MHLLTERELLFLLDLYFLLDPLPRNKVIKRKRIFTTSLQRSGFDSWSSLKFFRFFNGHFHIFIHSSKYGKIPKISPSKYKPPKPVMQKTLR